MFSMWINNTWQSGDRIPMWGSLICRLIFTCIGLLPAVSISAQESTTNVQNVALNEGLFGHWPMSGNLQDKSSNQQQTVPHGDLSFPEEGPNGAADGSATFNGTDSWIEVPSPSMANIASGDFSIALWVHTEQSTDDVLGDLVSMYDAEQRCGFQLSLKTNSVTTSVANDRHLTFGIDHNRTSDWIDCGRPGNALLAFALTVHNGILYAGTCEPGSEESGHVYRYQPAGKDLAEQWIDCGAPDRSNAVTALAVLNGSLYAGTGRYRVAGSALPESENAELGGRIFRYEQPDRWVDCGQLPNTEAVGGMVVFQGQLYASSLYRPAGFFRYDEQGNWTDCGTPDGRRVVALGIYNGHLYATSYDGGFVFRYDGQTWTECGQLPDTTQTYSFAVYQGRLLVGTWPGGRVYRFEEVGQWTDIGRLGDELEVMGMLVHNGRLIAGTLPLAEVYAYQNDKSWQKLARLDHTPDVKYRRAWTMAEHSGRVYCSTLPSGKIYSMASGHSTAYEKTFPPGWHHVTATKCQDRLSLFIDGRQVAESVPFSAGDYQLPSNTPLKIGFGQNDFFRGRMSDVRIYGRCLNHAEISGLATRSAADTPNRGMN